MTKFPTIWYNAGLNYVAESYINHIKPSGNYEYIYIPPAMALKNSVFCHTEGLHVS